MSDPAADRDRIDGLLETLERHASGTLRAVAQIREELARREAANEERAPAPAPVPEVTRQRALQLLGRLGYVPSGEPTETTKAKKRAR